MTTAVITLSNQGARLAERLRRRLSDVELYIHQSVDARWRGQRFSAVLELTASIFSQYRRVVYIAPCGVVVRAIAPCLRHKTTDPAVVAVDVGGRWAVSLLSGHEGGANDLAVEVANALDAEPVVSTTTEAVKTLIVGIGCRRGARSDAIVAAVKAALDEVGGDLADVRLLSSADLKSDEEGLIEAAHLLGAPIRFVSSREIRESQRNFVHSEFVQEKVNLPAVAEPAALLAGRRTTLLLPKRTYDGVTVAVAQENCLWSESAPAVPSTGRTAPSKR